MFWVHVLLPVLIVAVDPDVPIEGRYPGASMRFHCTFDGSWDENYDGWPDRWTRWGRAHGSNYPRYIKIAINEEPSPAGERCLRFDMDGKAAVAESPPIDIGPLFGYVLEGYISTEGLVHDQAYFSLALFDRQRKPLQTFYSQKVRNTDGWKKLRLGPVVPKSDEVRYAVVRLHVKPERKQDLTGTVRFDDIWLGRLPRMALKTSDSFNLFDAPEKVEIFCTMSGFLEKSPRVTLELEDVLGNQLLRQERRLKTKTVAAETDLSVDSFSDEPAGVIGQTRWKPAVPGPGFYRVRATMKGQEGLVYRRELTLAVIEPDRTPVGGEFGWCLPRGASPMSLVRLNDLLGQAGINWVKFPFWHDVQVDQEYVEDLVMFTDRLAARGIEVVGLLHDPPPSLQARLGGSGSLTAAEIFALDPKVWYPSLESTMGRLASRVQWWQLGDDRDTSYVDHPNLAIKIGQIKAQLDQLGQDVNLALGWGWIHALPESADKGADKDTDLPWRSLVLSANPPMTHHELTAYLESSQDATVSRWAVVQPDAAG